MKLAAAALVAGLAAGAWVNGQRWESKYVTLQRDHAHAESQRKDKNLAAVLENQASILDSVQRWQAAAATNEKAYAQLTTTVIGLRGTVSGLRGDFASLPGFVSDASREALSGYAAACTSVFERMAGEVASLGEAGARIARSADGHAADALR